MNEEIILKNDPSGISYHAILEFALKHCSHFSIIERFETDVSDKFYEITTSLRPYLIKSEMTSQWPGTSYPDDSKALLYEYRVKPGSIEVLKKAKSLFSWLHPDYPEDLTFYTPENRPWLVTTSHESYAFIDKGALPNIDHQELFRILWENGEIIAKEYI